MGKWDKIDAATPILNALLSSYYLILGVLTGSWWLLTLSSYHTVLGVVRLVTQRSRWEERAIARFSGWMLILLTLPLVGTVILSVVRDRGQRFHMIVMIAIAAYAFTRVTLAIVHFIRSRRAASPQAAALRSISLADALASIFALQRSMLVSFEGMSEGEIVIMNAALGTAVCGACFTLGLLLVRSTRRKAPHAPS